MNNMLAILTALVFFLSGFSGVSSMMQAPVVEETSVSIRADAILNLMDEVVENRANMMERETRESYLASFAERTQKLRSLAGLAATLVNQMSFRMVIDRGYIEAGVNADGAPLLNAAASVGEQGITLASSLLGDTVLTLSGEETQEILTSGFKRLKDMFARLNDKDSPVSMENLRNIDMSALTKVIADTVTKTGTSLLSRIGTPESGLFMVDDMPFSSRVPFNISVRDLKLLSLKAVKEILESAPAQKLVQMLPQSEQFMNQFSEKLAAAEAAKEDQPIYAYMYVSEDGTSSYFHVKLHQSEKAASFGVGVVNGITTVKAFTGADHKNIKVSMVMTADGLEASAEMPRGESRMMTAHLTANKAGLRAEADLPLATGKSVTGLLEADQTGIRSILEYGEDELMSEIITVTTGGEVEKLTDGAEKTFSLTRLLNDEKGEARRELLSKVSSGAFMLLARVMSLVGTEENAEILMKLFPTGVFTMTPGTN